MINYMCVRVCIRMYVYVCICMYVCMDVYVCTRVMRARAYSLNAKKKTITSS